MSFFRKYPELTLVLLAGVFLAFVIGYFFWGISDVIAEENAALKFTPQSSSMGFDLKTAASLNYRGVINPSAIQ